MEISPVSVQISGDADQGTFYGMQTLMVLPVEKSAALKIPAATIEDYPRFAYRGAMLDVDVIFDVSFVKNISICWRCIKSILFTASYRRSGLAY